MSIGNLLEFARLGVGQLFIEFEDFFILLIQHLLNFIVLTIIGLQSLEFLKHLVEVLNLIILLLDDFIFTLKCSL